VRPLYQSSFKPCLYLASASSQYFLISLYLSLTPYHIMSFPTLSLSSHSLPITFCYIMLSFSSPLGYFLFPISSIFFFFNPFLHFLFFASIYFPCMFPLVYSYLSYRTPIVRLLHLFFSLYLSVSLSPFVVAFSISLPPMLVR
jgi:hypothetical protein